MFRRLSSTRRLPSPALSIALLALFLAVGGGAIASATGGDKTSDKKIAKNVVLGIAGSLSVSHANTALSATHESTADSATVGGPMAYAAIKSDGTVIAAHSRGVTSSNVTTSGASSYCIKGLPSFKTAQATLGYVSAGDFHDGTAKITFPDFPGSAQMAGDCPGAQLEVTTVVNENFTRKDFFLAVFN